MPLTDTMFVNAGVPAHVASLGAYRRNVMLPVGLVPPASVAESVSTVPRAPPAEGVVLIVGLALMIVTDSSAQLLSALLLLLSPE